MTSEEKAAVMQLMGQTYGQIKKQDNMLVGTSGSLRPKSTEMKTMVEDLVRAPVTHSNQQGHPPIQQQMQAPVQQAQPQPAPIEAPATITPEQAMAELHEAAPLNIAPQVNNNNTYQEEQGMLDFSEPDKIDQLIEAVRESNLLLKGIKLQLENSNVRPKRKTAKTRVTE